MPLFLALLALTPAGYRAQAATVCRQSTTAEAAVARRLSPQATRSQALATWPTLLSLGRREVRRLHRLDVPPALRTAHDAALAAHGAQLDLFAHALTAVRSGRTPQQAAAGLATKLTHLVAAERAAWRRAGVAACAQS